MAKLNGLLDLIIILLLKLNVSPLDDSVAGSNILRRESLLLRCDLFAFIF